MNIDELYPSRFLRCADLGGKPLRVTIANIKKEDVSGEQKVVLSFTGNGKSLILTKTNARSIAKSFGNETRGWCGKSITLVPAVVDFRGDSVDAIRIRVSAQAAAAGDDEPPFDDELDDFRS